MGKAPVLAAGYAVGCMDTRDNDITRGVRDKVTHLIDLVGQGHLQGSVADKVKRSLAERGVHATSREVAIYRGACAGGGWGGESKRDIKTILDNGQEVLAFFSIRHKDCASLGKLTHYTDSDVGVMITIDLMELDLLHVPVYRAHLEIHTREELYEPQPLDLEALVAYAAVKGTGPFFDHRRYDINEALAVFGLGARDEAKLAEIASRAPINGKGLLKSSFGF